MHVRFGIMVLLENFVSNYYRKRAQKRRFTQLLYSALSYDKILNKYDLECLDYGRDVITQKCSKKSNIQKIR